MTRVRFNDWGAIERADPSPLQEVDEIVGKAVIPGDLPLQFIRGITFPGLILQCRDASSTVSGTLTPDVTGFYAPSGNYNGSPLYILPGTLATFLYVHPIANRYVIAQRLSDATFPDFWVKTDFDVTTANGEYAPSASYSGTATVTDNPVDLTGYTAEAYVRRNEMDDEIIYNLNPSVSDPVNGEITIPLVSADDTAALEQYGLYHWDLVLVGGGNRFGPYVAGEFTIVDNITQ